jgi:hypothetical protein
MKRSLYSLYVTIAGLLLALGLMGCSEGGNTLAPGMAPTDNEVVPLTRGDIRVQVAWPEDTRTIPLETEYIRVEAFDNSGEYHTVDIVRPANEGVLPDVAGPEVRLTAVAFDANDLPIAWGISYPYIGTSETIYASVWLYSPLADFASGVQLPHVATAQLVWTINSQQKKVIGAWDWWSVKLKDAAGQYLPASDNDWTLNTAVMFTAAGGKMYIYYFPGTETTVQLPIVPDWVDSWGWDHHWKTDVAITTRGQFYDQIPSFNSKYVTVTPGDPMVMQDLGTIVLTPGSPVGSADVEVK